MDNTFGQQVIVLFTLQIILFLPMQNNNYKLFTISDFISEFSLTEE